MNKVLIYFFVPILTIHYLPEITLINQHIWLVVSPWLIYLGGIVFFELYNTRSPIPKKVRAVLVMTSGIGSVSFVGFPIFEMLYGKEGLSYGIVLSLAGTFVVCNTVGTATGFWYKHEKANVTKILKDMVRFPPFLAMLIALTLGCFGYQHHPSIKSILSFIGAPFSILALFTIGLNLKTTNIGANKKYFLLGQMYKLVIAPFLVYGVLFLFSQQRSVVGEICILGAGLGSMNTIAIIAADLKLKPQLAYLMPGLGIPVSIVTVLFIHLMLTYV